MNKLFTKIGVALAGIAMAVGVGVAVGSNMESASTKAAGYELAYTLDCASASHDGTSTVFGNKTTSMTAAYTKSFLKAASGRNDNFFNVSSNPTRTYWAKGDGGPTGAPADCLKIGASSNSNTGSFTFSLDTTIVSNAPDISKVEITCWGWKAASELYVGSSSSSETVKGIDKLYTYSFTISATKSITIGTSKSAILITEIKLYKESSDTMTSFNVATSASSTSAVTSGTVEQGKTLQLYATAVFSSAGALNVTSDATWTIDSADQTYATVSGGLIAGRAVTTSPITLTVSYSGSSVEYSLNVVAGPTITTSPSTRTTILVNQEKLNAIEVTTANWSSDPEITADTNSELLVATITKRNNKTWVDLLSDEVDSDTDVTVTVSATLGQRVETHDVKVTIKAMVVTLSASSVNLNPDSEPAELDLTVENFASGYTVAAVSSDDDIFTVEANNEKTKIIVTPVAEGNGTFTVTVANGNDRSKTTAAIPVSVAVTKVYSLVTDDADLTPGSELIIASGSAAMGAQDGSMRSAEGVSVVNNQISGQSDDIKTIVLEGDTDEWYLKVEDGYLSYGGGTSNNIATETDKDDAVSWTISINNSNEATISPSNASTRAIKYNSSNPRFCVYSGQTAIKLYGILVPGKEKVIYQASDVALEIGQTITPYITDSDGNEVSGYTLSTSDPTKVSVSGSTITAVANGSATITASREETEQIRYVSVTFTASVVNSIDVATAISTTQGLEDNGKQAAVIKGIISEITEVSTGYGNATYYISDDGSTTNQFLIFRGKYLNGDSFTSASQISVGDQVIVSGDLYKYVKNETTTLEVAQGSNIVAQAKSYKFIKAWIDSYMHMNDSNYSGDGTGLCKSAGTYLTAKAQLAAVGTAHPGAIALFQNNDGNLYTDALARYIKWAAANGDAAPFNGQTTISSSNKIELTTDSNSTTTIIIVIAAVSTLAIGGFFFLRKRKIG